jgi:GTP-sensing pleiotropic transcriptional regulator CodY
VCGSCDVIGVEILRCDEEEDEEEEREKEGEQEV